MMALTRGIVRSKAAQREKSWNETQQEADRNREFPGMSVQYAHAVGGSRRNGVGFSPRRRSCSSVVHPIPAEFNGNLAEHVRRYPQWVLGVVVLAWGATGAAATWAAWRVGNRLAGSVVALLLAWGLSFNLTKLPLRCGSRS